MITVTILGSGPNVSLRDSDFFYVANSAGSFHSEQLKLKKGIFISLIAASEIVESKRNNESKQLWLEEKYNKIINSRSDCFVLLGSEFFPESIARLTSAVQSPVCFLYYNTVSSILHDLCDKKLPLITNFHFKTSLIIILKRLFKYFLNLIYFNNNKLISGLYRPSTGIISLLYAIKIHGNNAIYYVEGISFNNRQLYPDNNNNTWTPRSTINSNHVFCDKRIIQILISKGYNISIKNFDE